MSEKSSYVPEKVSGGYCVAVQTWFLDKSESWDTKIVIVCSKIYATKEECQIECDIINGKSNV